MATFHVGDIWLFPSVIKDKNGTKVDPGAVSAVVKQPNGKETTVTMSKTAVGEYEGQIELTEAGPWIASVKCTGTYQASQPTQIPVLGIFNVG